MKGNAAIGKGSHGNGRSRRPVGHARFLRFASALVGVLAAVAVLLLLAASRMFVSRSKPPDLVVREIDVAADPAPPPPPPPAEAPPLPAPPPPVALTDVEALPDLSRVPVAKAEIPMDVEFSVDLFSLDAAPPPLPGAETPRRTVARTRPTPSRSQAPRPKSVYSVAELDGKPRLLSHPAVSFPAALARRGVRRGTVVLEVELDRSGSVRVRRVISSTHSELVPKARQLAAGSKFTPPLRHGRPVRAVMRWPITIRR